MIYQFKPEDRVYYAFLESQGITEYFEIFFKNHRSRIETSFLSLIEKMKKEENEKNRQFIAEMDCNQFAIAAQFTFSVMFAKDFFRTLPNHNPYLATLSARVFAKKMSQDPQNNEYINQLEKVLSSFCDSIYSAFKKF